MFLKRLSVLLCLLCAADGYAFKVQYGNFFTIDRVRVEQGMPVLPLTRGKYENVRILDKETFAHIQNCSTLGEKEVCKQPAQAVRLRVGNITAVRGQATAARIEVVFDERWLVTVLAEDEEGKYKLTFPTAFSFAEKTGKKKSKSPQVQPEFEKQVTDFIQQKLKEQQQHEVHTATHG